MKIVTNVILYSGIISISLGLMMFFYGVHMFTARGEFSTLEKSIAEISIVFWMPTIFVGLIITVLGFIIKRTRRAKSR